MKKKAVSSFELAALVHELQFLVRGKLSQIYQYEEEVYLQCHVGGRGKQLLKVVPGKFLTLCEEKQSSLRPSGFCMLLRKYIGNATIMKFEQHESERVVVFSLEKKEKFTLIIELFSTGNIVLCDEQGIVLGALNYKRWKDRVIKPKEPYQFPQARVNWKTLKKKEFAQVLNSSEKRNLATSLATEIGLGGVYAEELCLRAAIDKRILPGEVSSKEIDALYMQLQDMLTLLEEPKGYVYENEMSPFALSQGDIVEEKAHYYEAIALLNPYEIVSPYEKKIAALERRIEQQRKAIAKQEEDIAKHTLRGELIYENYSKLSSLKEAIATMHSEGNTWQEIKKELLSHKKIASVDLRSKKIVVTLDKA